MKSHKANNLVARKQVPFCSYFMALSLRAAFLWVTVCTSTGRPPAAACGPHGPRPSIPATRQAPCWTRRRAGAFWALGAGSCAMGRAAASCLQLGGLSWLSWLVSGFTRRVIWAANADRKYLSTWILVCKSCGWNMSGLVYPQTAD